MIDVAKLLDVIRQVHAQRADDLCWMDIDLIFKAAGLEVTNRVVGNKKAMLRNCERYIAIMCKGDKWKTYVELEKELENAQLEIQKLRTELYGA